MPRLVAGRVIFLAGPGVDPGLSKGGEAHRVPKALAFYGGLGACSPTNF